MLSVLNTDCFSISGRADIQRPHGFSFICKPVKKYAFVFHFSPQTLEQDSKSHGHSHPCQRFLFICVYNVSISGPEDAFGLDCKPQVSKERISVKILRIYLAKHHILKKKKKKAHDVLARVVQGFCVFLLFPFSTVLNTRNVLYILSTYVCTFTYLYILCIA